MAKKEKGKKIFINVAAIRRKGVAIRKVKGCISFTWLWVNKES